MMIENLQNCSGCHACYSICPKSAINMVENYEGFLYPTIDKHKCISCGLCEKVCPVLNPLKNEPEKTNVFSGINIDEKIRIESSSGGVFSVLAEKIINEKGIVFGAMFSNDFSVIHGWTELKKDIVNFRGSKYLQSVMGGNYKDCENFLKTGRKVLFTGTPCQIQGLKKYLGKEYDNLYTMDLICHGVPSNKIWQKYIEYILFKTKTQREDIVNVSFRRKDFGWKKYSLSFSFKNKNEYLENQHCGWWMLTFNKNIMMRNSCYSCSAKGRNIVSDITVGDFWGIEKYLSNYDDKGTSIIICNTEKGANLLNTFAHKLTLKKVDNYDAKLYNTQLIKSIPINKNRDVFIKCCIKNNFKTAYEKFVRDKVFVRLYKKVRHFGGQILRKIGVIK